MIPPTRNFLLKASLFLISINQTYYFADMDLILRLQSLNHQIQQ
jgi:hypothetical protein